MLFERLKRWLGWDSASGSPGLADLESRPRSSTPPPRAAPTTAAPRPTENAAAAAQQRSEIERSTLDILDNPRLSLDKPADDGFDPYNTGAFNRSSSWERIGRQRKR
jgi:hypothetical protein